MRRVLLCCWHPIGVGTEGGDGGSEEVKCCFCGQRAVAMFRYEEQPIPGHGPYAATKKRLYSYPELECKTSLRVS